MACEEEFRYPHGWTEMEHSGLVVPRPVRDMLEKRDRDLEDFISGWPCGGGGGEIPWFEGTGYFTGGDTVFQLTIDSWEDGSANVDVGGPGIYLTPDGVWQMTLGWSLSLISVGEPPPITMYINSGDFDLPSMEREFTFVEADTDLWVTANQMTGSFFADDSSRNITASYFPEDAEGTAWVTGHLIHERSLDSV